MRRFPEGKLRRRAGALRGVLRNRMRMRRLRSVISPADLLTLGNALAGLLAIAVLTNVVRLYEHPFFPGLDERFSVLRDDRFLVAGLLITLGLVCDSLDGIVARKFGGSRLGGDLDTLADACTFVTAPALMILAKYGSTPFAGPALLSAALVFIMGLLRLARFNSNPIESETKTFQGLPTPWASVTIVLMIVVDTAPRYALPAAAIIGFLMMSNAAYPKSRGDVRYITYLMVATALVVVFYLVYFPQSESRLLKSLFILVGLSVALSPLLLARRRKRDALVAATGPPSPGPDQPPHPRP